MVEVSVGGKSPPVQVPIELWCRLCDAARTPPDTEVERVVVKVEAMRQTLRAVNSIVTRGRS